MNYPLKTFAKGDPDSSIVEQIQNRLNELGSGPVVVDGIFGKKTDHAVRNFQSQHCDGQGHPLTIDGKVGILTWSSLFDKEIPPAKSESPVINKVIEIAHGEIGVSEVPVGSNKGPRVEEYLRSVRLGPGFPWCAAFVFWCYYEACFKLRILNPLVKVPGCMQHWKKTTGTRITTKQAMNDPTLLEPGMIFIISRGDGKGHTGIVTGIQDGFILTIEGNTNNTHSSEGVKVCALRRKISTINPGFIRYCFNPF